ncbi:MAG: DUF2851 family protein [Bacteroidales bacterium]|nr:DUF2851 family protein [Bacteroidales bacterium]
MFPEKFYQYLWQHRLFYPSGMQTTDGEEVEVINPGFANTDAGPDFFNAQVRIGGTYWAGNVEIHRTSDDWVAHRHNTDPLYNNVILHVVAQHTDTKVVTSTGRQVPELVMQFPDSITARYEELLQSNNFIRCQSRLSEVAQLTRDSWLDRLLLERFEQRNERVEKFLSDFGGDWEQTFFCLLARSMGFVVNAEPMEQMARQTPVRILLKHNNITQMEALLFGQAGLLPQSATDEYTATLIREYDFLKAKFDLKPINGEMWKFLRLRPQNFPTIRLSQLAAIIALTPGNFESAFRSLDVASILKRLEVSASEYWNTHFLFGKTAEKDAPKKLGLQSRRLLIINVTVPFVFAYAHRYGNENEQLNVVRMLQFLPTERNSCLDKWKAVGLEPHNEGEAQALLLLYKKYCQPRRCLSCRFGHEILTT